MPSYQDFLLSNAARIASIESTLRSLTWFLPGRFKDAELASEALYAALNLLSLYHDGIITKAATSFPASFKPLLSSHGRYTSAWSSSSSTYHFISHALTIISHTELLLEMCARRKLGSRRRWRVVLTLECVKAVLRLRLVTLTGRMLINPPLPQRSIDPSTLDSRQAVPADGILAGPTPRSVLDSSVNVAQGQNSSGLTWVGRRTGVSHLSIENFKSFDCAAGSASRSGEGAKTLLNQYLSRKALSFEQVLKPSELVRKLRSNKAKLAEFIWILRPVIYVLAINRYGRHHSASFLFSLSIEYLSFSLRHSSVQEPRTLLASPRRAAFQSFVSELERAELNSRRKAFWAYFLRGPLWVLFTKPKLLQIASKMSNKPFLNLLSMAIQDYTPLIDEYYYYTS